MSGFEASATGGRRSPWVPSGQVRRVDVLLNELFEDLEHGLEEYPYLGTRPPLRRQRSSAAGGMLLGMASAAALVAGLALWMTLRPRPVVLAETNREPLAETVDSSTVDSSAGSSAAEAGGDAGADPVLAQESPESPLSPAVDGQPGESPKGVLGSVSAEPATRPSSPPSTTVAVGGSAPAGVASAPASVRIPAQPVPQMKLVGLIHDPGAPKALILIDNVVRQVPVGHAVKAEWRVTSISPYGVGVSDGRRSFTLQLGLSQRI